jgi:hypothetical protein
MGKRMNRLYSILIIILWCLFCNVSSAAGKKNVHFYGLSNTFEFGAGFPIKSLCNWMETKESANYSVADSDTPKYPKRRWIRYDKKVQRWFFRSCK